MNESGVYSEPDLNLFQDRLDQLNQIVRDDAQSGKHPEAMTTILERKLKDCGMDHSSVFSATFNLANGTMCHPEAILHSMQDSLSELSVELVPIHQQLVHLRRQLVALGSKPVPPKAELKLIQEELRDLDAWVS